MAQTDKTLFCFCHWGGENIIRGDGSVSYTGGVTDQIIVKSGTKYDEFVKDVLDRLGLGPSDKVLQFSVKFDRSQLIVLKDQDGVDKLIQFNDDFAHVYVSKSKKKQATPAPVPVPPQAPVPDEDPHVGDSIGGSTTEVEAAPFEFSEGHVSFDPSTPLPVGSSNDEIPVAAVKWSDLIVGEGQVFEDANAFRRAMFKYAFANHFDYKYTTNKRKYVSVRCAVNGCPWKVTVCGDESNQVSIRKFTDSHTHPPLDLGKLKCKMRTKLLVGEIMQQKVLGNPNSLPRDFCNDVERTFGIKLSYSQAYSGTMKIKKALDEKVEETYKLIPWLCNRLIESMPGTVATWSCTEGNRFRQLFVSYECSIRGFHAGCRPLIFIDVIHVGDLHNNIFLAASTLDANDGVYPLAYGVLTSMSEEDSTWFFEQLKLVVQDRDVVIVSDTNASILSGLMKIFGKQNCAHCLHCVKKNFEEFIGDNPAFKVRGRGNEVALRYLDEIAYARTLDAYNEALGKMYNFRKELYNWVIASEPAYWSNALFRKPRWDKLKSVASETFNALIGEAKSLPIPEMLEAFREKLSQLLQNERSSTETWELPVGPGTGQRILENQKLGDCLVGSLKSDFEFDIRDSNTREESVNLRLCTCTCLEWQMIGIPCRHACRAIALANMDVYPFVASWYKREVQDHIYAEVMLAIPRIAIPHPNQVSDLLSLGNDIVLGPSQQKVKRPPGRPRNPNSLHVKKLKRRKHRGPSQCSACGLPGHKRSTCKKSSVESECDT